MNEKQSILEQRLRLEKPGFSTAPGFTERVMDQLPVRPLASSHPHTKPLLVRFVSGFAIAACIALVLLQVLPRRSRVPAIPEMTKDQSTPGQSLRLPNISVEQVQELTAKLDEPLENELKNVISDTRQAIQFIASNFLPENQQ